MTPLRRPRSGPCALALTLALTSAACVGDDLGDDASAGTTAATSEASTSGEGSSTSAVDETSGGEGSSTGEALPPALPPLGHVPLTTEEVLALERGPALEPYLDPRIPSELDTLLDEGYGGYAAAPGEPLVDLTLDLGEAPTPGPGAAPLTRFVHLADTQLTDDESPTRVALLDSPDGLTASFRPQESYGCRVLNAAVRTINAIDGELPLDFVLLGGDNIDSAQANELRWFGAIMDGGPGQVHCDSAVDDDPVPGPDNDPKDPFTPVGLDVPWRWVSGNHDVLVQGNFVVSGLSVQAVGDQCDGGTRDWSEPGGPVIAGTVPADPARALLTVADLLAEVASSGDGHGIDAAVIARGRALYSFVSGGVRVLVVDSAAATGAAEGVIHAADVDAFIRPALDQAEADGEPVIVTSHHCSTSLGDGGGLGGAVQDDALTADEWQALLGEYPGVVMHLCAHSHTHRVRVIEPLGGHAYWEVKTASLVDAPQEMRLVEVRDEDNGQLSITGIAVDYAVTGDPLADAGRVRANADHTSGWHGTGAGELSDRNVRLWVPWPG